MNKDLEATLAELDPACRTVVTRLRAAREVTPSRPCRGRTVLWRAHLRTLWHPRALLAASLLAALTFAVFCLRTAPTHAPQANIYTLAYQPTSAAQESIIASQQADGSWANDFLTRQNAAALRDSEAPSARLAYRRAVRYLRTKNLTPLTPDEWLKHRHLASAWRR